MRFSKQILIIIIYNCAIWTTGDFDGWVAERGVSVKPVEDVIGFPRLVQKRNVLFDG